MKDKDKTKKQLIKELNESKRIFQTVTENAEEALFLYSMEGQLLYVNSAFEKITGYTVQELYKNNFIPYVHPDDQKWTMKLWEGLFKGQFFEKAEYRIIRKDGEVRWNLSSWKIVYDEGDKEIGIQGRQQDITDRKRSEEQIRNGKNLLKSSIESPNMIILSIDKQYRYVFFNEIHKNIMISAYGKNIDLGINILDCITDKKDREKSKINYDRAFAGEKHSSIEEYGDIERSHYETRYNPMLNENNEIIGATAFSEDVTNRIQAEENIKSSLKEKETLLHEIHHRVKNNFTIVSSLLSLQASRINDERLTEALLDSKNRVQSMSAIHETLYQSDNLSVIDMNTYLSKLTRDVAQNYTISTKLFLKIEAEHVVISAKQASPLGLIVNEMITNSFKYAFPDNQVGEIEIRIQKLDDQVLLVFKDNGVGMPEGFDWKNTKSMGLSLVKILAESQLDGSIDMESKNGTKFTIRFNIES
jgi:PAS domain S-box-containing protein